MKNFATLLVVLMLCGCQSSLAPLPRWQGSERLDHPRLGVILDLRSGRHLQPEELVDALARVDRLLVGEQHDNADHHALQLWLLQALQQRRPQGSLLLEMLEPSQQEAVTRTQQVLADGKQVASLENALSWQVGWPWPLYGPLVSYALEQPYPLLAANLDRHELMAVFRAPPVLSGTASNQPAVRDALIAQLRESHCGMLSEEELPAMLGVQQQRDRRMAVALQQAPTPSMLLAGAFHVRRDVGVPLHLEDLRADEGVRVLLLAPAGSDVGVEMADYVWFTAAPAEKDYCADFRGKG